VVSIGMKEDCLANCTWIRGLKYDWTEGRQEVCRLDEELDKDAVCCLTAKQHGNSVT